jgi:non-homologous end joining protein Ku
MNNKYDDLLHRIEALEAANFAVQHNFSLIREILNVFKEIPICKLILQRAQNRQMLFVLKYSVLPRRIRQLKSINSLPDIPPQIRQDFINSEKKLIRTARNSIRHRQFYDSTMAKNVKELLDGKHKRLLLTQEKKHA